jgi:hypothetical protein
MMAELDGWDNFYVMGGIAVGALIGLQFVVLTLLAERPPTEAAEVGAAFLTPTIVHFGVTLLLSAFLLAPWQTMSILAALLGIIDFSGVSIHRDCSSPYAKARSIPPRTGGLVFSCCAAFGRLLSNCMVSIRGILPLACCAVWCWCCCAAIALRRHS